MAPLRSKNRDPFLTEAVRITHATELKSNPKLAQFLRSARFDVADLEVHGTIDARLAHFSQNSLALISTPQFSATWRRGPASRTRAIMMFARKGELEAISTSPVIRRGGNALLIPPRRHPRDNSGNPGTKRTDLRQHRRSNVSARSRGPAA